MNSVLRWLCIVLIIAGFMSLGRAKNAAISNQKSFTTITSIEISMNEIQRENKPFKLKIKAKV